MRDLIVGGWFEQISVQVRQGNNNWVDIPGQTETPAYPGMSGANFETYVFDFPAITGDGIRIYGVPGGAKPFVSVAELRVFAEEPL